MATFTHELRDVIKRQRGDVHYSDETGELVVNSVGGIGLSTYPVFDDSHRAILNEKIVRHYYTQEIGQESIPLFTLAVSKRMHEIMPYMNDLYRSQLLEIEPLLSFNMTTVTEHTGEQSASTLGNSASKALNSADGKVTAFDTPQTKLSETEYYASGRSESVNGAVSDTTANEFGSSEAESTDKSETTVRGYQGSPSDLLMSYRATILNVDLMIVENLQDLFMVVWNTGDNYYKRQGLYTW